MPMNQAVTLDLVGPSRGKSFSNEENARIRTAGRELLKRHASQVALAEALGVSQPTLSNFLRVEHPTGAGVQLANAIAHAYGVTLDELRTGAPRSASGAAPRFGDMPGWDAAETEARRIYGKRLPPYAWSAARQLMGAQTPTVLNAVTVYNLVASYWEMMSDEVRAEAIRQQAEEEMAREDADADALLKARHAAREKGEPLPPMPDDPASVTPRKRTGATKAAAPAAAHKERKR